MRRGEIDPSRDPATAIRIRTELRPGDIGTVIRLHGSLYAEEYGFDHTFEAYVAGPLAQFSLAHSERERMWIAERDDRILGSIAIVSFSPEIAQLRWFLVDPAARGTGLGKRLLNEAVGFCGAAGYRSIVLWTVSALTTAAHLYRSVGFERVEEKRATRWSVEVVEEKYELVLG